MLNFVVLLRPALLVVERLRTSARLGLLCAVLVIPAVMATTAFTTTVGGQIAFTQLERTGAEQLRPALYMLTRTAAGVRPDLESLHALNRRHPELDLKGAISQVEGAGDDPVLRTEAMTGLITEIGNQSNLVLDPDLDSFYVMDALVVQLPKVVLAAAKAGDQPTGSTADRVAAQAVRAGELTTAATALRTDVETAVTNSAMPGLRQRLAPVVTLSLRVDELARQLSTTLDRPAATDASEVLTAAQAAVDPALAALDDLLAARVDRMTLERNLTLAGTAGGLFLGLYVAAALWWRTRRDVALTVHAVHAIATGDLAEYPVPGGRDELGDIGGHVAVARQNLVDAAAQLETAQRVREEHLQKTFTQQRSAERQARERAQQVIDETSAAVVGELDEVVQQVQAVRSAAGTIDERVGHVNDVTRSVVAQASAADRVVSDLTESLHRVAGTAELIAGVADQTKTLALNATIEAARAGEAGRGFSVVAGEVKALAMMTARSTEEITRTVAELERDATAMSSAILSMSAGIGGVDEATAVLAEVASRQHSLVQSLDQSVGTAITRVRALDRVTESLNRRQAERVPAVGVVVLQLSDLRYEARMVDISISGLGCRMDKDSRLGAGQMVRAEFTLLERPVSLMARIARVSRHDGVFLGLEYQDLDPAQRQIVAAYVATEVNRAERR